MLTMVCSAGTLTITPRHQNLNEKFGGEGKFYDAGRPEKEKKAQISLLSYTCI